MLKFLLYGIFVFLSFSGYSQHFKMLQATSQRWSAGIKQGGTGINYNLTLLVFRSSEKLKFNGLWIGKQYYAIEASKKFPFTKQDGFNKKDTVYIHVHTFFKTEYSKDDSGQENQTPANFSLPFQYNGKALLYYTAGKKKKYFVLENFDELPYIPYP